MGRWLCVHRLFQRWQDLLLLRKSCGSWMSTSCRKHGHGKFMWGEGCMYEASGLDCCRLSPVCLGMLRQIPGKLPQQRHARGRLDFSSGAVAIGKAWFAIPLIADQSRPRGRYVWADGRQYNGEWVENQMPAAHTSGLRWFYGLCISVYL